MSNNTTRKIVGFELIASSVAVFMWGMVTLSMGFPSNGVAVGAVVALLTAGLVAGADRSRPGLWVFGAVGVLAIVGVVLVGTEPWVLPLLPISVLGLGIGWFLNRVLFGVVWSIPETRVERGFRQIW